MTTYGLHGFISKWLKFYFGINCLFLVQSKILWSVDVKLWPRGQIEPAVKLFLAIASVNIE